MPSPSQPKKGNERKLVLVLDDDPPLAETMSDIITRELNWDAVVFNEAASALDFLVSEMPDMIVLDVIMPGIDGLEFYDRLKDNHATRWIPVLFVSGVQDTSGLNARNVIAFLRKPFDASEFLSAVEALLGT